jgi:hypothetical protein
MPPVEVMPTLMDVGLGIKSTDALEIAPTGEPAVTKSWGEMLAEGTLVIKGETVT